MKEIVLTQGKVAWVDDEDYELVQTKKWSAYKNCRVWYVATYWREGGRVRSLSMHQFLLGSRPGQLIDHKDNNGLNNTRSNLRVATHAQNAGNRRLSSNNKSGFKGVFEVVGVHKTTYRADCHGKMLGHFPTKELAAKAYDEEAVRVYGEFAQINFQGRKVK